MDIKTQEGVTIKAIIYINVSVCVCVLAGKRNYTYT